MGTLCLVVVLLSIAFCQEVLQGKVGPPFHLEALREFTAAQLMDENIFFLLEVNEVYFRSEHVCVCFYIFYCLPLVVRHVTAFLSYPEIEVQISGKTRTG